VSYTNKEIDPSAVLVQLHALAHGGSCECNPKTRVAGGLKRWCKFFAHVLKKVNALRARRDRGIGVPAAEAALNKEPCGFDFVEMRSGLLILNKDTAPDGDSPTTLPLAAPTPPTPPRPRPACQRSSRAKTPGIGSSPDELYGHDMDMHVDRVEAADLQRRDMLELQQRARDAQTQMDELSVVHGATMAAHATERAEHATEMAAKTAAHQRALAALQARERAAQLALERERERVGEERGLRADAEEGLKRERERSTAELQAAGRSTTAALRAQDTEQRSNNERTREEAARAKQLAAALAQLQRKHTLSRNALESERAKRKEAVDDVIREQDLALEALRTQDAELRSNNQLMFEKSAGANRTVLGLQQELARARQVSSVQQREELEAELRTAQLHVATLNKTNATLRASVAKSGTSQKETAARAVQQRVRDLEVEVERNATHMRELEESEEAAEQAADCAQKRQRRTHKQALRRGNVARVELKQTKQQIKELKQSLNFEVTAAVGVRSIMDARHDNLLARLEAGESHNNQLLTELRSVGELGRAEAKQAAMRHQQTLAELTGHKDELNAYRTFQAKEGGRYKASVRMCYYKLIDMKVPTNQIEEVVGAVLGMVGSKAPALPKRSIAQNMRREMEHWADAVAGRELAAAHHVCGASDDTTKRQRTLAADVTHHLLPG
jgi:hypothetical protein